MASYEIKKEYAFKNKILRYQGQEWFHILSIYAGCSKVVITNMIPVKIMYHTKTQKALLSFYIQRYSNEDIAVDLMLCYSPG